MSITFRHLGCLALFLLPACAGGSTATSDAATPPAAPAPAADVRTMLETLAADSMEGRATGTPGSARAARWIEARMREYGLEPAVDGGYRQRVPLVETRAPDGTRSLSLPGGAADTVSGARTIEDVNVLMISQGASRRNVSFVIEERDVDEVVRRLHREFFES